MLAKQVYHAACRISYRTSDISLNSAMFYGIITLKGCDRIIDNIAVISAGNNVIKIFDFKHAAYDEYCDTFFKIEISSEGFCGISKCKYNLNAFKQFINELSELYDFKRQNVVLNDQLYGSKVNFESDKLGHIEISGEIFGFAKLHGLSFTFNTDQAGLTEFIKMLRKLTED